VEGSACAAFLGEKDLSRCQGQFEAKRHSIPPEWQNISALSFYPSWDVEIRSAPMHESVRVGLAERKPQLQQLLPQGWQEAVDALFKRFSQATMHKNAPIVGVAPPWLISSWETGGRKGWWEAAPMSHEPNAALVPPRAVLATAASLDLSVAESIFKIVSWRNLPSSTFLPQLHSHAAASQRGNHGNSPKLIMLTPKASLWSESAEDVWELYRQFLNVAAIAGVSPCYA
jgi:hypothetical protein